MNVQEFNKKYNCKGYAIEEVKDYNPEFDEYRYNMTKKYKDWTHPEAAFNSIEEAEEYIEYMEKMEEECKNLDF